MYRGDLFGVYEFPSPRYLNPIRITLTFFYGIIVFHNKDFIYIFIVFFSVFVFAKKILPRRFFFLMAGVKEISAKTSPTELRSSRVL